MTPATAGVAASDPVFAHGTFYTRAHGLGFLIGRMGLGAIAGTLTLVESRGHRQLPGTIMQPHFVAIATLLVYAASPNYWLSLALVPVLGMSIFRTNAATNTMIQLRVPENCRGRIMGLCWSTLVGMLSVTSLIAGALAARIGPCWTVAAGGVEALVAGVFNWRNLKSMKNCLEAPAGGAGVGLS